MFWDATLNSMDAFLNNFAAKYLLPFAICLASRCCGVTLHAVASSKTKLKDARRRELMVSIGHIDHGEKQRLSYPRLLHRDNRVRAEDEVGRRGVNQLDDHRLAHASPNQFEDGRVIQRGLR